MESNGCREELKNAYTALRRQRRERATLINERNTAETRVNELEREVLELKAKMYDAGVSA